MIKIECFGKTVIDEWGERLHTTKPKLELYLPKGILNKVACGTKFKVTIEELDAKDDESVGGSK